MPEGTLVLQNQLICNPCITHKCKVACTVLYLCLLKIMLSKMQHFTSNYN